MGAIKKVWKGLLCVKLTLSIIKIFISNFGVYKGYIIILNRYDIDNELELKCRRYHHQFRVEKSKRCNLEKQTSELVENFEIEKIKWKNEKTEFEALLKAQVNFIL